MKISVMSNSHDHIWNVKHAVRSIGGMGINMVQALRAISVERGYDPRDFVMVTFGGAGRLHAAYMAREHGLHLTSCLYRSMLSSGQIEKGPALIIDEYTYDPMPQGLGRKK